MLNKKTLILYTVLIVLLGFLRGYLFGNINWIYKTLTVNRPNSARDEFYFLLEWSPSSIMTLKWGLTILFLTGFAYLSYLIVKTAFNNKTYEKITLYLFLGILGISGALFVAGYLLGISDRIYHVIRTIMGLGQSFMPIMILTILFKFFPQKKEE